MNKHAYSNKFYYKIGSEEIEFGTFSDEGNVKETIRTMKKDRIW